MVPTLLVILTLAVLYRFPIRRWISRWGTTPSDLARVTAGDGLLAHPTYSGTMAVIECAARTHLAVGGGDRLSAWGLDSYAG